MKFFKVLPKEKWNLKSAILRVHDKSCNNFKDFRPATLLKRLQHRGFPVNIPKILGAAFFMEQFRSAFELGFRSRKNF